MLFLSTSIFVFSEIIFLFCFHSVYFSAARSLLFLHTFNACFNFWSSISITLISFTSLVMCESILFASLMISFSLSLYCFSSSSLLLCGGDLCHGHYLLLHPFLLSWLLLSGDTSHNREYMCSIFVFIFVIFADSRTSIMLLTTALNTLSSLG